MSKAKIKDPAFASRLQLILKEKFNNNTSEFARSIGVAITSLNRWLLGEADPSRTNLLKTAEVSGVSLEWLATGNESYKNLRIEPIKSVPNHVAMINSFVSINVSAGFGSFNDGVTEPDGEEPYSENLLASLGLKPANAAVFWANGDSMEPTIKDGDQMLVDLSRNQLHGDSKIYLVQNGDSVWVKRVKKTWEGIELISDNKEEYDPIFIPASETEHLQIIGQVVHIGHCFE